MKLRILFISDLHSRFEELAQIATSIKQLKNDYTIILDGGDNADFMRLETEGTSGRISSALLNKIGFDARVFGNNEGFAGKKNGKILAESSNFSVITCNMYDMEGKKLDYLEDSIVLHVEEFKVLIIGVTAPYNIFYNLFEIDVKDPYEEISRVLANYDEDDYDLLVLLSHLGLDEDKKTALKIPSIDIIIGNHSHIALEQPVIVNNTIICQAGKYGEHLGLLDIDFDRENRIIRNFEGKLIPSKNVNHDPEIIELIQQFSTQAEENMSTLLYLLDVSLDHSLTEENAMGNILADSLNHILKTDFSIINSGVMNKGIDKGKITKKLLHEVSPSPLNPTSIDLRGNDLLITLEKSLLKEYQLMDGSGAGFRGKFLGNIQVSNNVQVRYNPQSKPFQKILTVLIDGQLLDPNRWYRVGTSDYLQRGTGYKELANSRNEEYRPEFIRDVLEVYLNKQEFTKAAFITRFSPQI
ncbi:MAG: bifunctional metallophosphatase/5'-nucleotidase [Promethearchaeota archaeon]